MRFGNSSFTYDLQNISTYALGVAPQLQQLVDKPLDPSVIYDTTYSKFVADAHSNNLTVLPFTLKND
jgi:glycerophosphoryl diester phosphodiesterase